MNDQRVAIVTGAASGMGLAIARRFAANGHPVAMLDLQEHALAREAEPLRAVGGRVLTARVDITDRPGIEAVYDEVRDRLGPISIVVANAGICWAADIVTLPPEDWSRMIEVNLTGTFHTIQPALPDMIEAGWGRIVTIASNAGQSGVGSMAHYSASKGGVIALTKSLAQRLAPHGITVNTVPPWLIDTPMAREAAAKGELPPLETLLPHIPIGRAGTGEDIADAVEFLCSDKASYITGQQINVNGGVFM